MRAGLLSVLFLGGQGYSQAIAFIPTTHRFRMRVYDKPRRQEPNGYLCHSEEQAQQRDHLPSSGAMDDLAGPLPRSNRPSPGYDSIRFP